MNRKVPEVIAVFGLALFLVAFDFTGGAKADTLAGISSAVTGDVQIVSADTEDPRLLSDNELIFVGDTVTTGPDSRIQILLEDGSVFTVGPATEMRIDGWVVDEKDRAGVVTGLARLVTGCTDTPIGSTDIPTGTQLGIRTGFPIPYLPPVDCDAPCANCFIPPGPEHGAE